MGEVVNLSAKAITPKKVLETAAGIDDLTHAYVVVVREGGRLELFGSGDLSQLPSASLYLQHYATKFVRGEIEE